MGGINIKSSDLFRRLPFYYGWAVLGLSFLALFASFGIRVSFGAYITSWEHEFSVGRTWVTIVSLISFFTLAIAQPTNGRLNDRYGARAVLTASMLLVGVSLILCSMADQFWQLALLYGVAVAAGLTGASNITATAVITRWFTAKRGLAMGLTLSGMAVGQLVVVPLSLYMVSNYGWRFATGAIGVVLLAVFLPLMFLFVRSKPEDIGLRPYGETNSTVLPAGRAGKGIKGRSVLPLLKQRNFWLLTMPYFVCGFTDVGLVDTHLIPFAEGKGFPTSIVAVSFSLIAVANIIGTIGTGYLSDRWRLNKLLAVIYGVRALTFIILIFANRPWLLVLFAALYGVTEMASIAPCSAACAGLFRQYPIGTVFGLVSVSHQLGGAIGSLVPGVLYDLTGSYLMVFLLSIILLSAGSLTVLRVPNEEAGSGKTV